MTFILLVSTRGGHDATSGGPVASFTKLDERTYLRVDRP